jgi:hypothetical protein
MTAGNVPAEGKDDEGNVHDRATFDFVIVWPMQKMWLTLSIVSSRYGRFRLGGNEICAHGDLCFPKIVGSHSAVY